MTSAPATPPTSRSALPAALLVAVVAVAAYAATLRYSLVWDDLLLRDAIAGSDAAGGLSRVLTARFALDPSRPTGYYRPVVLLSLWLDARTGGGSAVAYHLTNVLLHAACSLAVLGLLAVLLGDARPAVAGALVFAVHPIHVESVAWVSGRTDLWAALWTLVSAVTWLRVQRGLTTRASIERAVSLGAFALACLSKEVAFLLPAALLAGESLTNPKGDVWKRARWWVAGWGAVLLGVFALRASVGIGAMGLSARALGAGRLATEPGTILPTLLTYLRLLVAPWPAIAYYTAEHVRLTAATLAGAAVFVGLCVLFGSVRDRRIGWWALVWTVVFLVPVCGLVPQDIPLAERFLYLPSVGIGAVLAAAVARSNKRVVDVAVAALVLALGAATIVRARTWRDDATLFADMVRTSPQAAIPRNNLGKALMERRRFAEAEEHLREAVRLDPEYAEGYSNLAAVLGEAGRLPEAAVAGEHALRLRPAFTAARVNLLITYRQLGLCEDALRVVFAAPPSNDARLARQVSLVREGCTQPLAEPGVAASPAPSADPTVEARELSARGNEAAQRGQPDEAVRLYRAALAKDPADAKTRNNLARVLLTTGHEGEALKELQEAVRVAPMYGLARLNLGMVLARQGRFAEAAAAFAEVEKTADDPGLRESAKRARERLPRR